MKMDMHDIRLYLLNIGTLSITFTHIEEALKILLLLLSIGYTIYRWIRLIKDKNAKTD